MSVGALKDKLVTYSGSEDSKIVHESQAAKGVDLQKIRDALLDIGEIVEEDLDHCIYVAKVPVGPAEVSSAMLAACVDDDSVCVASYSEGPRGQERAKESMRLFLDAVSGNPRKARKRHGWLKVAVAAALFVVFVSAVLWSLFGGRISAGVEATEEYNSQVSSFNKVVPEYNAIAEEVAVENVRGIIPRAEGLETQPTDPLSVIKQVAAGNGSEKIRKDADTVRKMRIALESDKQVLEAINNPNERWIEEKLQGSSMIDEVEAVSSNNDPNNLLGKEGGYTACVYFTTTLFNADGVSGDGPVAKGVDGGGAIESYSTLADARARCEYLAGFDGTLLSPGSYALVGTMVVRTSCLLVDDAQYDLTNEIVKAMVESAGRQ